MVKTRYKNSQVVTDELLNTFHYLQDEEGDISSNDTNFEVSDDTREAAIVESEEDDEIWSSDKSNRY